MVSILSWRRRNGGVEKGKEELRREKEEGGGGWVADGEVHRSSKEDWAVVAEEVDADVSERRRNLFPSSVA